ncbi:hypothetical protein DL991_27865 [Amycolatopsis sp. WAC 01375]|nr:hypothetical protein DL991_27865 [Amycolatopsis sp. WAC 01375]RSN35591.1 hypothetical protein DL990_05205 [Amycolatopsis sp. WAC 01416]
MWRIGSRLDLHRAGNDGGPRGCSRTFPDILDNDIEALIGACKDYGPDAANLFLVMTGPLSIETERAHEGS